MFHSFKIAMVSSMDKFMPMYLPANLAAVSFLLPLGTPSRVKGSGMFKAPLPFNILEMLPVPPVMISPLMFSISSMVSSGRSLKS